MWTLDITWPRWWPFSADLSTLYGLQETPPLWFHRSLTASCISRSFMRTWRSCVTWSKRSHFNGGTVTYSIPFWDRSPLIRRCEEGASLWRCQNFPGWNNGYVTPWSLATPTPCSFLYPRLKPHPPLIISSETPGMLLYVPCHSLLRVKADTSLATSARLISSCFLTQSEHVYRLMM